MPKGGGGGQDKPNSEATFIVGALLVCLLAWLLWTQARQAVVYPLLGMDWLEYRVLRGLGLLDGTGNSWSGWVSGVLDGRRSVYTVDLADIADVQADVGRRTRIAFALGIFGLAILVLFRMKGDRLKSPYTLTGRSQETVFRLCGMEITHGALKWILRLLLKVTFTRKLLSTEKKEWKNRGASFAHFQAQYWKVTLTGAHFDPDKCEASEMPQLSPMEWLRDNKVRLNKKEGLDDEGAERAFERQLGPTWQGIEKAPYHVQAIMVMAGVNAMRDKRINSLRERLTEIHVLQPARAAALTRELIAPYMKNPKLMKALNAQAGKHAFLNTAAIGVYGWGGPMREWGGGKASVLATSMFRWLKPIDRTLWYCLNNVGRRAYHIEGAGGVSHYQAEYILRRSLPDPYVAGALEGLLDYLDIQAIEDLQTFFKDNSDFQ